MLSFLSIVYNIIGPIFLVVGLAILIERRFAPDPRALSRIVVYLFSPCLILDGIARSDLQTEEMGLIVAMATLSTLLITVVGWGLARLFRFDPKLESAFVLSVALINAGNYGLPLNEFAFGRAGLQRAVIFYIVTAVEANTLGVYLASRGAASVRRSLLNVLAVPLPYATALGLILNVGHVTLPLPLNRAITLLSQATVPCMLVILGLQLSRTSVKGRLGPILLATVTRLAIAPLITAEGMLASMMETCRATPERPSRAARGKATSGAIARRVTVASRIGPSRPLTDVRESCNPRMTSIHGTVAVMSGVLATEFGSDAEFTTAVVLVSTLASIVTLSILLSLVM